MNAHAQGDDIEAPGRRGAVSKVGGGEHLVKPDDAGVNVAGGCQNCNPIAEVMGVIFSEGTRGDVFGGRLSASREGNGWDARRRGQPRGDPYRGVGGGLKKKTEHRRKRRFEGDAIEEEGNQHFNGN